MEVHMVPKWLKSTALFAISSVVLWSGGQTANAATQALGASGWSVTIPDSQAGFVSIDLDTARSTGGLFFFTKTATLQPLNLTTPIILSFDKTSANAGTLVIGNEVITNGTGQDWNGYRMIVSSGSVSGTPNFGLTTSDAAAGIGTFSIDPFTTFTFVNANTEIDLGGGTVKAGDQWKPGSTSGTGLSLIANNSSADHFTLKELPLTGAGPGPTPIPLPTAAWAGLTTLVGLSLVSAGKKAFHRLF
jgi:hypothetical protein